MNYFKKVCFVTVTAFTQHKALYSDLETESGNEKPKGCVFGEVVELMSIPK